MATGDNLLGPFFSADGAWVGFEDFSEGLKKVSVDGGPVRLIAPTFNFAAGSGTRAAVWDEWHYCTPSRLPTAIRDLSVRMKMRPSEIAGDDTTRSPRSLRASTLSSLPASRTSVSPVSLNK